VISIISDSKTANSAAGEIVSKPRTLSHRSIILFVLLTIVSASAALSQPIPFAGQMQTNDGPTIVFTATTVSCTGLAPGDLVALIGFSIDRKANSQTVTTPTISYQADANGAFTATIEGGVKPRSIWLLIDETAFSYTVASPEGSVLRQLPDAATFTSGEVGSLSQTLLIQRAHTHVVTLSDRSNLNMDSRGRRIKPADATASALAVIDAKDGSASDTDGAIDGVVHVLLPNFADPSQRAAYLFVVDDRTLEFRVLALQFNSSGGHCRPGEC